MTLIDDYLHHTTDMLNMPRTPISVRKALSPTSLVTAPTVVLNLQKPVASKQMATQSQQEFSEAVNKSIEVSVYSNNSLADAYLWGSHSHLITSHTPTQVQILLQCY